jgi:hypothetical protein
MLDKLRDKIEDKQLRRPADTLSQFEERLLEKRAQAAGMRLEARRSRVQKLVLERARRLHLSGNRRQEMKLQQSYYQQLAAAISADQAAISEAITTLETAILPLREEAKALAQEILRLRDREQQIDLLFRPSSELKQSLEGQLETLGRELADLTARAGIDGDDLASDWWREPKEPFIERLREPSFAVDLAHPHAVASPQRRAEELTILNEERRAIERDVRVERLAHNLGVSIEDAKLINTDIVTS